MLPFQIVFSILLNFFASGTEYDFELSNVGQVDTGLYAQLPSFEYVDEVLSSAISIAIISFVIHTALAKLIAKRERYSINSNQVGSPSTKSTFNFWTLGMARPWCHECNWILLRMLCRWILIESIPDSTQTRHKKSSEFSFFTEIIIILDPFSLVPSSV